MVKSDQFWEWMEDNRYATHFGITNKVYRLTFYKGGSHSTSTEFTRQMLAHTDRRSIRRPGKVVSTDGYSNRQQQSNRSMLYLDKHNKPEGLKSLP
jgi:hypothetical protein